MYPNSCSIPLELLTRTQRHRKEPAYCLISIDFFQVFKSVPARAPILPSSCKPTAAKIPIRRLRPAYDTYSTFANASPLACPGSLLTYSKNLPALCESLGLG